MDESVLRKEIAAFRQDGLSNRQITVRVADIMVTRYGIRPTQAVLMSLMSDPAAGKSPSTSTIQQGLKDYFAKTGNTNDPLGPPDWPAELRARATEIFAGLTRLAGEGAAREVDEYRTEADARVSQAQSQAQDAERDRDRAHLAADAATKAADASNVARETAERQVAELTGRLSETQSSVDRLSEEGASLSRQIEEQRQSFTRENEDLRQSLTKENEELRLAHDKKLSEVTGQFERVKEALQKEVAHIGQLLTANEETIKHLRVEVSREVDKSEQMRLERKELAGQVDSLTQGNMALRERVAAADGRLSAMEQERNLLLAEIEQLKSSASEIQAKMIQYLGDRHPIGQLPARDDDGVGCHG